MLQLRHVVSLGEHASFRRAAADLQISQPALTKSIQGLETKLGVKLFERRRDGVVPTEFGKLVIKHAHDLARCEGELMRQISLLAGLETGSLTVALGPLPAVMSSYEAIGALLSKHPNLNVAIQSPPWRDVPQLVLDRKVDIGIAELSGAALDGSLHSDLVGQHRAHFCCRSGHPVLSLHAITLEDLLKYPWATTRLPARHAAVLPKDTGRAGRVDRVSGEFIPAIDVGVPTNLGRLIVQTDVLLLSTLSPVEQDLMAGALVIVPTQRLEFAANYGFIYLKGRPLSPACLALVMEIRSCEQKLAAHEKQLEARFRFVTKRLKLTVR